MAGTRRRFDIAGILDADKLQRAMRIGKVQEALIAPDEVRRGFLRRADAAMRGYRAVLPDDPGPRRSCGASPPSSWWRRRSATSSAQVKLHHKVAVFEWYRRQQTRSGRAGCYVVFAFPGPL